MDAKLELRRYLGVPDWLYFEVPDERNLIVDICRIDTVTRKMECIAGGIWTWLIKEENANDACFNDAWICMYVNDLYGR